MSASQPTLSALQDEGATHSDNTTLTSEERQPPAGAPKQER